MSTPVLSPAEIQRQSRLVIVRIVRMVFAVMVLTTTLLYILKLEPDSSGTGSGFTRVFIEGWWIPLTAAFLLATLVFALDILTPVKKLSTLAAVFLGLLAGIVATFALGLVVDLIVTTYGIKAADFVAAIKIITGICLCYLAISTVLQTQDDFRLVVPYVEFAKQIRGAKPLVLDSSALIDARIADLGETGLLQTPLLIPASVLAELQALADSQDKTKRLRGRRGLDIVARLQRNPNLDVSIDETPLPQVAVDQQLVELARLLNATVVTTDTALQRVAAIHNVPFLNLNDVANSLKPALLPGSRLTLRLIRPGEQPHQGVGFLDDGTMVVVDHAADRVGVECDIEITSSLQTSAGRLLFARPAGLPANPPLTAATTSRDVASAETAPFAVPEQASDDQTSPFSQSAPADEPPRAAASGPQTPSGPLGPGRFRRPGPPRNPRR